MKKRKFLVSRFFIRRSILIWIFSVTILTAFIVLLILGVGEVFVNKSFWNLIEEYLKIIRGLFMIFFIALSIWATFYLFIKTMHKREIEAEKAEVLKYDAGIDNEAKILFIDKVLGKISGKKIFIHFIKTMEEILDEKNISNFILVVLILITTSLLGKHPIFQLPLLAYTYIAIVVFYIVFFIRIIFWEIFNSREPLTGIIGSFFAIWLLCYMLYASGLNNSFFELLIKKFTF